MNLYAYIASNNPRKANMLLRNNGFGEGKSTTDIEKRLKMFVREEKEEALREMAKIHPDKELLVGDGVSSELLNYSGGKESFQGERFIQNLDTTTYYGPRAQENPYRPIAPDTFNNAIGVSYPVNPQPAPVYASPQTAGVINLSQQDVIMLLGFGVIAYLITKRK
jgi:hypothetical protein